jgi:hypothetical protein
MKKTLLIILVTAVVVGGGAFYGGMKYQQSKNSLSRVSGQGFQNLTEEQRQQMLQGNAGAGVQSGRGNGANFLAGEVISKDEKSLTLKASDGGSKIIFFSASTKISKMIDGSADDLEIGKTITVNGQQNSDGSYTASTIQLTPRFASSTNSQ